MTAGSVSRPLLFEEVQKVLGCETAASQGQSEQLASIVIALDDRCSLQFTLFTGIWRVKADTLHRFALSLLRAF